MAAPANKSDTDPSSATPRVSVILTVYKRTDYLIGALKSILQQSYPSFEVIVADDSGTAASRRLVADYESDRRVRYLAHPSTLGIASSLVRAVEQARGEFVAILNDDDTWEKDLLAELTGPLEADRSRVAAFSDHWVIDSAGRIDEALSESWSANAGRSCLPGGIVHNASEFTVVGGGIPIATCAVFRKDAVAWPLVQPGVAGAYDYWISCLLVSSGKPVFYVPKRLARYRVHSEMETLRRGHDKGEDLVYILATMRAQRWFPEQRAVIRSKLADALFSVARNKLHFGRSAEARRLYWRCFLVSSRPRAFACALSTFIPRALRTALLGCVRSVFKRPGPKPAVNNCPP